MPSHKQPTAPKGAPLPQEENGYAEDGDVDMNNIQTQDPQVRREIRFKYRQLTENIKEQQHELTKANSDGLQKKLEECNNLFKNVKMTREAALDSQVVAQLSHLGKQKAQALQTDLVVFQPTEFCDKLIKFLRGGTMPEAERTHARISKEGWVRLGEAVQPFLRRSPSVHFMYGAFEHEEKQKKERKTRSPDEDLARIQKLKGTEPNVKPKLEKKESTTEAVASIGKVLISMYKKSDNEPLCYFEFIINPYSFDQTVENMFYTSFLIRDGLAQMSLDADKLPVIEPVPKTEGVDPASLGRHQVIMMINKQEWREIVEAYNIQETMIPTRARIYNGEDDYNPPASPSRSTSKKGKASATQPAKRSRTPQPVLNGVSSPGRTQPTSPKPRNGHVTVKIDSSDDEDLLPPTYEQKRPKRR